MLPPLRCERHRHRLVRRSCRAAQAVHLPIVRQDAPAGARTQLDAELLQGGVDAERTQLRIAP